MSSRITRTSPGPIAGGKALGLSLLLSADLPVPDALVILPGDTLDADVVETARALGEPLIVRSSGSWEDGQHSAPGVFLSIRDVPLSGLLHAVDQVRASVDGAAALAYAAWHDLPSAQMAVVVQRQIRARAAGTLYTLAPQGPRDVLVWETHDGQSGALPRQGELPAYAPLYAPALRDGALHAEKLVGGPADLEWAWDGTTLWWVQLRPLPLSAVSEPQTDWDAGPGVWRWDAAHNPAPLSTAQESVVRFVDAQGLAPVRQTVVCGYLFVREDEGGASVRMSVADATALLETWEAERIVLNEIVARAEREVSQGNGLAATLAAYGEFYRRYAWGIALAIATIKSAWRTARGEVRDALDEELDRPLPHAPKDEFASSTTVTVEWDVIAESHQPLERSPADSASSAGPPPALSHSPSLAGAPPTFASNSPSLSWPPPTLSHSPSLAGAPPTFASNSPSDSATESTPASGVAIASASPPLAAALRVALRIGDQDDVFFARAQNALRAALLHVATTAGLAHPDDIFHVSIDQAMALERHILEPGDLVARANAHRALRDSRRQLVVPERIIHGRPLFPLPRGTAGVWLGRAGGGGQILGVCTTPEAILAGAPFPAFAVLVCDAVTPSMGAWLAHCIGLVAIHGGLLGHGAALARERGMPYVVGCRGASTLRAGDRVRVEGAARRVIRLP